MIITKSISRFARNALDCLNYVRELKDLGIGIIFGENLFDDFFNFPAFDDRAMQKAQKKLYGRHAANMMKTDVQEHDDHYEVDIDLPAFYMG